MRTALKPHSEAGFTIVELVVVIALLGILAAVALPRFLSVGDDAKRSVFDHLEGKLHSVAGLAYSQAVVNGVQNQPSNTSDVVIEGLVADLKYGYPEAKVTTAGHAGVIGLLELTLSGGLSVDNTQESWVRIGYNNADNGCYLQYQEPDSSQSTPNRYTVTRVETGCDWNN